MYCDIAFWIKRFFPSLVFVFMLCVSVLYPSHQDAPCMDSIILRVSFFTLMAVMDTDIFPKRLLLFLFYLLQLQRQKQNRQLLIREKQNRQLLIRVCTCKSTHRFFIINVHHHHTDGFDVYNLIKHNVFSKSVIEC